MKILWVKANKLLPVYSGGDIRSYNILRQLARRHQVTLLSYYDGTPDSAYESELQQRFAGAVCVCTRRSANTTLKRGLDYLLRLANPMPYAVSRFASSEVLVIMLMSDGELRRRYERAAAEFAAQYDWPVVGEKFSHALQEAVGRDSDSLAKETLGKHGA